ncbi:MAG: hypothetical protein KAS94_09720 [Desulfobulbaceae bacterium]|nr:hypothetical protein [Desulfobulbaceae bacterium]
MTRQSTVDVICNNVKKAFNQPQIRFLKILRYPASTGMRIGFDYRNGTKIITFSKRYLDEHSGNHLDNFLNDNTLARLKKNGDQHLQLD